MTEQDTTLIEDYEDVSVYTLEEDPGDEAGQRQFVRFLDSPRRVVLEVEPTQRIGFDGRKMGEATARAVARPG